MKTFKDMWYFNNSKTRMHEIPAYITNAHERQIWVIEDNNRKSAEEIYNELNKKIELLEEELKEKNIKEGVPAYYDFVAKPTYHGTGNHSVSELEKICREYQEFCHQFQIKYQTLQAENERLTHVIKEDRGYLL